jgi:hypothetical protein
LFLKISGKEYLEEQPMSLDDADALAVETVEATREIHEILEQDRRILVIKLDIRDFAFEDLNFVPFMKYTIAAASQGLDIAFFEVWGANSQWNYIASFLPKHVRDKIVIK